MKCLKCGTNQWKRDKTRKHGRPPRFFVKCANCGASAQAVENYGTWRVFHTSIPGDPRELKRVRSVRLSDREIELIESGKMRLTICGGRITIAA